MLFLIPVEALHQNKGGVIIYDPVKNEILKQYVHTRQWKRNGWRGGVIYGDYLIATDWTNLHYFNYKTWQYEKSFTKNTFNDLHYLKINNNQLYVVNTGIDAIEIFNNPMDPVFKEIYFLFKLGKEPKRIFKQRDLDIKKNYNEIYKLKPHSCHPNCIEFAGKRTLVTCFRKSEHNNSGEIIVLETGKRLFKTCFDCHDGQLYKNDFYTTRTKYGTILVYKDIMQRNFPIPSPDKSYSLGGKGWWRGMLIVNDKLYIFASDGYRKGKHSARLCSLDLKTGAKDMKILPVFKDISWDTIYQPSLLPE
jgi:hypothetical protein